MAKKRHIPTKYLTDAGFADLSFRQTLIPGEEKGVIQDGFGKGAFVAVKGMKREAVRKQFVF